MKNLLIGGAALLAMLSLNAAPAGAQASASEAIPHLAPAKLENGDILDMVKAGLPEEVIIAKVQGSSCNFDTSPASLAALKSAQVPNSVILAMVKKANPTNRSEDRDPPSSSPRPGPSAPPEPARASVQQPPKGCMAVRPIGSHAFRNVMLLGVAGAFISHMQYEVVDAVGYPTRVGTKYHGNDLQTIQGNGTKVVLLDKHYTEEDLQKACR